MSRQGTSSLSDWEPKIDKNSFYRTTDILNGIFKKKIKLDKGPHNCTDLHTIWVNFGDRIHSRVVCKYDEGDDKYRLDCGHITINTNELVIGDTPVCWICTTNQIYLGFEHEWQHIIFKTNLIAKKLFVEKYLESMSIKAEDDPELEAFIALVVNAFDDIRCNSLWEKVYPGSAQQIWERWKRLTLTHNDYNTNFISFLFALYFQLNINTDSVFMGLCPIVAWGVNNVKYKGFMNMLMDVRIVLDRCIGTIMQERMKQQKANQDAASSNGTTNQTQPINAIAVLMDKASQLDSKEEHKEATPIDIRDDQASIANNSMINKVMNFDTNDNSQIDQILKADTIDDDMQRQLEKLQDGQADKSQDDKLTASAKAKVTLIDVMPTDIDAKYIVELDEMERAAVSRMRSFFFRTLGKKKTKRNDSGMEIDTQDLITYKIDGRDPAVFESDAVNQGFIYHVLSDMSGSMQARFPQVCQAMEMLKKALDFPFVTGNLWGFRGPDLQVKRGIIDMGGGEVWLYRYNKDCKGYIGNSTIVSDQGYKSRIPVECGGLTPMNSALRIAQLHLRRNMPHGTAKKLFLLTDGAPIQTKITGQVIPEPLLRKFVAKEIQEARLHGIEVNVLVIGENSLDDDECKKMFGAAKFWRRVSPDPDSNQSIHSVLTLLILNSFQKYISLRS